MFAYFDSLWIHPQELKSSIMKKKQKYIKKDGKKFLILFADFISKIEILNLNFSIMNTFKIEKWIPYKKEWKYDFIEKMEVWDSFLCTSNHRASIISLASQWLIKSKLKSKKEWEMIRIWKL